MFTSIDKAIAGGIGTLAAVYLAQHGLTLNSTIGDLIQAIIAAVLNGALIWFTTNKPTVAKV